MILFKLKDSVGIGGGVHQDFPEYYYQLYHVFKGIYVIVFSSGCKKMCVIIIVDVSINLIFDDQV